MASPTNETTTTPMTLCQRKEICGYRIATKATAPMPAIRPDERAGAGRAPCADRQDEHAEQRAIEERPEPVDDLDERAELAAYTATPHATSPQNAVAIRETWQVVRSVASAERAAGRSR